MILGILNRYHIAYGVHSRIPTCCIRFFIYHWERMIDEGSDYARFIQNYVHWGYVPCPKCLAYGNKASVRQCRVECGQECNRVYQERVGI